MRRYLVWRVAIALCLASCASSSWGGAVTPRATTTPATPATPGACHYQPQDRPDPHCNPGATNPDVTQANIHTTICVTGWTATIRPAESYTYRLKRADMAAYGDTGSSSRYEEDHLVPLEVGGSPTAPANLWPELWAGTYGAHAKDAIENRVHREVCDGQMGLAQGQAAFEGDWWNHG